MYVPVWEGESIDGAHVRIGDVEPNQTEILFFFTTSCPYCRATIPIWKRIASLVKEDPSIEVHGIALDSAHRAASYDTEHDLPFSTVAFVDPRYASLYRVRGVPLSLVVGRGGRVLYSHIGELTDGTVVDSILLAAQTRRGQESSLMPRASAPGG